MTGRPVDAQRRRERQDSFLAAFARTGILTMAGKEAGIPAPQHHAWVKNDPGYAERFALAKAEAEAAGLADANRRPRARNGKYGGERGAAKKQNQEKFLEALRRCGIAIDAANETGIVKATYNYWMRTDPAFAERAREAFAASAEARAQTVFERRSRAGNAAWADPGRRSEWARRQRQEFWTPERRADWSQRVSEIASTPETRAARSAGAKRAWEDPEKRSQFSETMRQRWENPEYRAKQVATMADPESRRRRSDAAKARWALVPPEERKLRLRKMRRQLKGGYRLTKIEAAVMTALNERGLPYFVHYPVDGYVADLLVPSLNLVIECDGAYYHERRNGTDEIRDAALLALGYETLRLSESEINGRKWERLDAEVSRLF